MSERRWFSNPDVDAFRFTEYWYYGLVANEWPTPEHIRVLKISPDSDWEIRFNGRGMEGTQHKMPPETTLEEVQAVALTLWRMR